jgi:TonB family protein
MTPIENIKLKSPCRQDLNYLNKALRNHESDCGILIKSQIQTNNCLSYYKLILTSVLLTLGLIVFSKNLSAQVIQQDSINTIQNECFIFSCPDLIPEFKYGGIEGLSKFLLTHLKNPGDSTKGKVIVKFVVDTLGKPQDIKILKSLNKLADEEVLRVIPLLEFKPIRNKGKKIPVTIALPIKFENEVK